MRLGFIGTGTIAAAIVEGLSKAEVSSLEIVVSPRNATIAQELEARFANVRVAKSNQTVLDASDLVVLAVRPQVAEEVLRGLRFRRVHHVVSLVATWPIDRVRSMVAPATTVARAAPLPFVANLIGPTPQPGFRSNAKRILHERWFERAAGSGPGGCWGVQCRLQRLRRRHGAASRRHVIIGDAQDAASV
jgi:hypothetical protein